MSAKELGVVLVMLLGLVVAACNGGGSSGAQGGSSGPPPTVTPSGPAPGSLEALLEERAGMTKANRVPWSGRVEPSLVYVQLVDDKFVLQKEYGRWTVWVKLSLRTTDSAAILVGLSEEQVKALKYKQPIIVSGELANADEVMADGGDYSYLADIAIIKFAKIEPVK